MLISLPLYFLATRGAGHSEPNFSTVYALSTQSAISSSVKSVRKSENTIFALSLYERPSKDLKVSSVYLGNS